MNYIGVESTEIAKERVKIRVSKGGHGIPDEDIERRYYESFKNLQRVVNICDEINIYDNTEMFKEIVNIKNGNILWRANNIPSWANAILVNKGKQC